jgi:hypothetical protein
MLDLGSEIATQPLEAPEQAAKPSLVVLTTAELAECTCPEFCERDHDID